MKRYHAAKEITVFLCCLLLMNRMTAYAGCQGALHDWRQEWGWESMAGWLKEDIRWDQWQRSVSGLVEHMLQAVRVVREPGMPGVPAAEIQPGETAPGHREPSMSLRRLPLVGNQAGSP